MYSNIKLFKFYLNILHVYSSQSFVANWRNEEASII